MSPLQFRFWNRYQRQYLYEPKKKATLLLATITVLLVLIYLFGIRNQITLIKERLAFIKEKETKIKTMNENLEILSTIRPVYSQSAGSIRKLEDYIPDEEALPDLLEYMSISAPNYGFQLIGLFPREEPSDDPNLKATRLDIRFSGSPQRVFDLIKELENYKRFIGVNSIVIGSGQVYGYEETRLDVTVYSLKEANE